MSHMEVDAQRQHIKDFLKSLTRAEKLIVVLYYYEEMTIGEIAKKLGLSESRIYEMYSSIIARCGSYLQERGLL